MKSLWTGSDVLFLNTYPPSRKIKYIYMFCFRIYARILDFFVQEHYVVSHHLVKELKKFGFRKQIKILVDPPLFNEKVEKIKHDSFNILYYLPKTNNQIFTDWLYGADIIEEVKTVFPKLNFIRVDGSQRIKEFYQITDFYLRPNRHDGNPRMIMECIINGIPYYWSYENPNKEKIIEEIKKWQSLA